ncbi:GNAT family N-acetyltransferase [Actinocorallia sp. A-T 12471]|uniref:GNAT family N-acetyltransferase n=1 Tax=Actinocorallia sp. A-T 12471 TaxID=3089813 RepID=UPI0029CC5316|nr:GNAT family N-acyltransferase [Actinocorallia sp. A-T 12471]MDX6745012.1 GNAT family N-acyltransferase [Actinocorallia sp. A-T 12471]
MTTPTTTPITGPVTPPGTRDLREPVTQPAYTVRIADTEEQVRAAQRLRHRVFATEQGACLDTAVAGHDVDPFDAYADHLLVVETATEEVVGTYRLFPPGRGPSYAATEFDLAGLPDDVRASMVETGRVCVDPAHRTGAVITLLWSGIARYVLLSGHRYLGGCASVSLDDGGRAAAHVSALADAHRPPADFAVLPRNPWQGPSAAVTGAQYDAPATTPPLLRAYLRFGAWICGAPHHDPAFATADFFVLLDLDAMHDRYRRFFLADR